MHAGAPHRSDQPPVEILGAEAVHQYVGRDPALRRAFQGRRYFAASPVAFEYVGLDMNLLAGGVEGLDQRREVVGPVLEQRDPVAVDQFHHPRTYFMYRRVMRCGQDGPYASTPTKAICPYGCG